MILTTDTRFSIGDTAYFLDVNHDITKGVIEKIDNHIVVYEDTYTEQRKTYVNTEYTLLVRSVERERVYEDSLFSTPDEIVAVLTDQIEKAEYDN